MTGILAEEGGKRQPVCPPQSTVPGRGVRGVSADRLEELWERRSTDV